MTGRGAVKNRCAILAEWCRREKLWSGPDAGVEQGAIPIAKELGLDLELVRAVLDGYFENSGQESPEERSKDMTTIIEKCKHVLTREEVREKADTLARRLGEITAQQEQKKEICARIKNEIDCLTNETKTLAAAVLSGYEYRDTECAVEMDYSKNEVRVLRLDTAEILRVRTMTAAEKQADLALNSGDLGERATDREAKKEVAEMKKKARGKVHGE